MQCWCFLDKCYHCNWCDYLDLTIVDDLFWCYGFSQFLVCINDFPSYFHGFSWVLGWFSQCFKVINGFSWFFNSFLFHHHQRCHLFFCQTIRTDVFEAHWPSYAIISDGRQPSVQQCDVCDVSMTLKCIVGYPRFSLQIIHGWFEVKTMDTRWKWWRHLWTAPNCIQSSF